MKLCKDCKWSRPEYGGFLFLFRRWQYAKCANPECQMEGDVFVDGNPRRNFCSVQRAYEARGNHCGSEGRFWEPRE